MIRKYSLVVLSSTVFGFLSSGQVSQSCDCMVDTAGLANYLTTLNLNENQPLTFEVENSNSTFAVLHGYITGSTPTTVQNFISSYPNVTTLVFMQVPGSENDNANLIASQALRNQGYKHYLPAVAAYAQDAFIASGGVDMFVGGTIRVVDQGAEVGVHSWSDGVNDATFYPPGHAYHQPYINYYVNMGFSQQEAEDFYYFTINAAPANGIHFMTENELNLYRTRTCTYSNTPVYSISQSVGSISADLAGASYQWLDCDNGMIPLVGETAQSLATPSNGSFAVIITENNCMDTSACFVVNNVSVDELEHDSPIHIYPNPVESKLNISMDQVSDVMSLEVRNITGQRLLTYDSFVSKIDIQSLPSGCYFLKLITSERVFTIQFSKE